MSDLAIVRPVWAERSLHGFVYLLDATGTRIATVYGSGPARTARALAIAAALNGDGVPPAAMADEPAGEEAPPSKEALAVEIVQRFRTEPGAWHIDGRLVRGEPMRRLWFRLDWDRARLDWGPSPAGNAGPYWHVPVREPADRVAIEMGWEGTVHHLYPRGRLAIQARKLRIAELQQGT